MPWLQILQSVENLLHRCVSKSHGSVLKHTETPKTPEDLGKGYGLQTDDDASATPGPESTATAAVAAAGDPSLTISTAQPGKLLARGTKALADLRVIGAYIVDFQTIYQALEESGSKRADAAGGATTAAPLASTTITTATASGAPPSGSLVASSTVTA